MALRIANSKSQPRCKKESSDAQVECGSAVTGGSCAGANESTTIAINRARRGDLKNT